jgi:hypothetical protein
MMGTPQVRIGVIKDIMSTDGIVKTGAGVIFYPLSIYLFTLYEPKFDYCKKSKRPDLHSQEQSQKLL